MQCAQEKIWRRGVDTKPKKRDNKDTMAEIERTVGCSETNNSNFAGLLRCSETIETDTIEPEDEKESDEAALSARLLNAAQDGPLNEVRDLLDQGANVDCQNRYGYTPLLWAVQRGNLAKIHLLLEKGADVNSQDKGGCTPLHDASRSGRLDMARILWDNGADLNCQDEEGRTPLHVASRFGHLDMVRELLDKGANANSQTTGGRTPLHVASSSGRLETVRTLLEKGANVNSQAKDGMTPLHEASRAKRLETVLFLLDALWNLAANDKKNKVLISNSGGVDAILVVMRQHPQSTDVQAHCFRTLYSLSSGAGSEEQARACGALAVVEAWWNQPL
jgi:ankyrin repeat protein